MVGSSVHNRLQTTIFVWISIAVSLDVLSISVQGLGLVLTFVAIKTFVFCRHDGRLSSGLFPLAKRQHTLLQLHRGHPYPVLARAGYHHDRTVYLLDG